MFGFSRSPYRILAVHVSKFTVTLFHRYRLVPYLTKCMIEWDLSWQREYYYEITQIELSSVSMGSVIQLLSLFVVASLTGLGRPL